MRSSFFLVLVLVGCAADPDAPPSLQIDIYPAEPAGAHADDGPAGAAPADLCALASKLPFDDICSLICDPGAMATRMAIDGSEAGTCYELYCALPDDEHVVVGVCLPP